MRIQIFSPHPDDSDIFVGGTLLKHLAEGDEVEIVLMTKGEEGARKKTSRGEKLGKIRMQETLARHLLVPQVKLVWLDFYDTKVSQNSESIAKITETMTAWQPDIIYLPESEIKNALYRHQDHINTGLLIHSGLKDFSKPIKLRHFHVMHPNLYIDISAYYAAANQALSFYKSQWGKHFPWILFYVKSMRYIFCRRYGKRIRCKYAEAFREVIVSKTQL